MEFKVQAVISSVEAHGIWLIDFSVLPVGRLLVEMRFHPRMINWTPH